MNQPVAGLPDDARDVLRATAEKIGDSLADIVESLGEEGDFSCTRCGCDSFVSTPPPARPSLVCARPTCRHFFTRHRVF
jgi:hypothetical protein